MKFSNFFLGPDGDTSSKRLFLLLLILVALLYFITNLFWHKEMKQSLEDYLFYSIWAFFGGVAFERWKDVFSKDKDASKQSDNK